LEHEAQADTCMMTAQKCLEIFHNATICDVSAYDMVFVNGE